MMIEIRKKRIIWVLCTILWMLLIFSFSAQPAKESSGTSGYVATLFAKTFVPQYEKWSKSKQEKFIEKINFPIRKGGHFMEYAVLGGLLYMSFYTCGHIKRRGNVSILVGVLYAGSDEFHQLFVPGRSGQITDVLLDSCGCVVGVLLVMSIVKKIEAKNKGV